MVITIDLSKLSELWITLESVITYAKQRIKECVKEAGRTNPNVKEKLKKAIHMRLNSNVVRLFYNINILDIVKLKSIVAI